MNYEQMVQRANALYNKFAANTPNANKSKFDSFPLEVRLVMTYQFFTNHCI